MLILKNILELFFILFFMILVLRSKVLEFSCVFVISSVVVFEIFFKDQNSNHKIKNIFLYTWETQLYLKINFDKYFINNYSLNFF